MEQLAKVHRRVEEMLTGFDVQRDGIYLCPHSPDDRCSCRKPLPGMVRQAMADHGFDPRQAWVKSILVRTGYGKRYESETKIVCHNI